MYLHSPQPFDSGIHVAFKHSFRVNISNRITEVFKAALKLRADRNDWGLDTATDAALHGLLYDNYAKYGVAGHDLFVFYHSMPVCKLPADLADLYVKEIEAAINSDPTLRILMRVDQALFDDKPILLSSDDEAEQLVYSTASLLHHMGYQVLAEALEQVFKSPDEPERAARAIAALDLKPLGGYQYGTPLIENQSNAAPATEASS